MLLESLGPFHCFPLWFCPPLRLKETYFDSGWVGCFDVGGCDRKPANQSTALNFLSGCRRCCTTAPCFGGKAHQMWLCVCVRGSWSLFTVTAAIVWLVLRSCKASKSIFCITGTWRARCLNLRWADKMICPVLTQHLSQLNLISDCLPSTNVRVNISRWMSQFSLEHIVICLVLKKKGGYVYLFMSSRGQQLPAAFSSRGAFIGKQNVNMVEKKAHLFLQEINM